MTYGDIEGMLPIVNEKLRAFPVFLSAFVDY